MLFRTATTSNRFTALHDVVTSTRVALLRTNEPLEVPAADPPLQPSTGAGRLGPFRIVGDLGVVESGRLLSAFDDLLKRKIWIHIRTSEALPLPAERRTLARPTRLRWLTGGRTSSHGWDAYEAPTGAPLQALPAGMRTWRLVRRWLVELATEVERSLEERLLPRLSVDRVWISSRGQAKLVDFVTEVVYAAETDTTRAAQQFLAHVAEAALLTQRESHGGPQVPRSAQRVLEQLATGGFASVRDARLSLEALLTRPDRVSHRRRAASILLPGAPLFIQALGIAVALGMMRRTPYGPILLAQLAAFGVLAVITRKSVERWVVLQAWQLSVADQTGSPVSRSRAALRAAVASSPLFMAAAVVVGTSLTAQYDHLLSLLAVLCWLAGAAYALIRPSRGLQDRLCDTWLIAR